MTKENVQRYAVLTGDVVGSSQLAPAALKKVMRRIREGAERFAGTFPDAIYGEPSVFSGDGWQLLMKDWKRSLRAALFLRALVKSDEKRKLDTRVAVAWGAVNKDSLIPERIAEATGEAFTRSGRALRDMHRRSRLAIAVSEALPAPIQGLFTASVGLLDELISYATPKQAQALSLALLGMTQEEIASEMGKGQSTVNQALKGAGWASVENFLLEVEYRFSDR